MFALILKQRLMLGACILAMLLSAMAYGFSRVRTELWDLESPSSITLSWLVCYDLENGCGDEFDGIDIANGVPIEDPRTRSSVCSMLIRTVKSGRRFDIPDGHSNGAYGIHVRRFIYSSDYVIRPNEKSVEVYSNTSNGAFPADDIDFDLLDSILRAAGIVKMVPAN